MKIFMCSFCGFESLNGSNLRVNFLVKEFLKRGLEVEFLTPGKKDAESCERRFGVKAGYVGIDTSRFDPSKLKKYASFAWKAKGRIDKDSDIVFGQSLPSALAVRSSKARGLKVADFVDLWSEYWVYAHSGLKGKTVYRAIRLAERHSMRGVDVIFTITKKLEEMIEKRGVPSKKIRIVRDGVDTEMFRPGKVPASFYGKYGLKKGCDYIIYQGGIAAHDGVQFLVNAVPLVLRERPDVRFLIVGAGEYLARLKEMVKQTGLEKSFIFTGWVPYGDMPDFMNVAKINAVPIPDAPATQGVLTLKLFEAMACGTPTIISDLPGVREHMRHKFSAYLRKSENREAYSKGLIELLGDKALYSRLKSNGLKMIKNYDWRIIARDMTDAILEEHAIRERKRIS